MKKGKTISSEDFDKKYAGKILGNMKIIGYGGYKNGRHLAKTICLRCGRESNRRTDRKDPVYCMYCQDDSYKGITKELTPFRNQLSAIKNNAKSRKIDFNLTEDEVRFLTQQPCYYCGEEPTSSGYAHCGHSGRIKTDYVSNGIDRVDSLKGYTSDNVVPCCGVCNRMKNKYSQEEFLSKIKLIYNKHLSE